MTFTALIDCGRPCLLFANDLLYSSQGDLRILEIYGNAAPSCVMLCWCWLYPWAAHPPALTVHLASLQAGSRLSTSSPLITVHRWVAIWGSALCSYHQACNSITVHQVHDISAGERHNSASVRQGVVSQSVSEMGAAALLEHLRRRVSNELGWKRYLWSPRGFGIRTQVF